MSHTCKNCGAVADDPGHLCNPIGDKVACSFCGTDDVSPVHVCREKLVAMKYSCQSCGRVAPDEGHLCQPTEIR